MSNRHFTCARGAGGDALRRAFSIVELLVVMGIVGLLAAMAAPFFGRGVQLARSVICQQQLGKINQALIAQDYGDKDLRQHRGLHVPDSTRWEAAMADLQMLDLTICPSEEDIPTDPLDSLKDLYIQLRVV